MRILSVFLLLLTQAALVTQAAFGQTVWRGATEYPATAMPGEGLTNFARLLAARSQGALVLRPAFDGPDGLRSASIPAAVQAGRIEVGDVFAGALSGADPLFQLSSLPFLATTEQEAFRLYQAARPAYARLFAARGQRLVYATPWPATGLWSRDPVATPDDLRGLVVRTYDPAGTRVMRDLGAVPAELSFADAMPRLKDGSVTALLSSGDGGAGRKLWAYLRRFTAIGYAMPLSFTTVSAAAYDALPEALRTAVDAAAAETEMAQWRALVDRTARNYEVMRANGVAIAEPAPDVAAALARAGAGVTRAWASEAGPDAVAVLDEYRR